MGMLRCAKRLHGREGATGRGRGEGVAAASWMGSGPPACRAGAEKAIVLTEHHCHAVLVSMIVPKLLRLWRASTMGEKALVVVSFALYGWAAFDVLHLQLLGALVKIAANGLLTLLLMWSLRQPKGTGLWEV
jgi:hypothetical protein